MKFLLAARRRPVSRYSPSDAVGARPPCFAIGNRNCGEIQASARNAACAATFLPLFDEVHGGQFRPPGTNTCC
jgi:hypothetical protein